MHEYVNRLHFNYRDHRKIACIDGDVAYTGGVNIADEYANLIERFGYWKDSGVCLEGEGAWGLTASFIRMCVNLGGVMHNEHDYYRPIRRSKAGLLPAVYRRTAEQPRQSGRGCVPPDDLRRAALPLYHDAVLHPR